jgi:DNA-directed RNA polymerase subunit beta'
MEQIDNEGNSIFVRYETTPGRVRLGAMLPLNNKAPFDTVNRLLRKKEVGEVIDVVYRYCGQKESVIFCDQIMTLGFREAFKAGISFGKDDMVIPDSKWHIVNDTRDQVKEFEQQYLDGLITQGEKYNKVVDSWSKCSDAVADAMMGAKLSLYDGPLWRAWFSCSDEAVRRYAGSYGQAEWRDHRNTNYIQL